MKKTEIPEPRAEKIDKIMTIHDHQRIDEFYWLNERDNPKVIEYLNAENTYRVICFNTGMFFRAVWTLGKCFLSEVIRY